MLIQILYQILELNLEFVNIMLNLFCQELLSLCFSSTWVSNQSCSATENKYWAQSREPEVIQYQKTDIVANMNAICSRVHSQIDSGVLLLEYLIYTFFLHQPRIRHVIQQFPLVEQFEGLLVD